MKNCPWFSLRSNSIELRLRSVRRGNFFSNLIVNFIKAKAFGIRFAHIVFYARFARSRCLFSDLILFLAKFL